jgi:hypothetical protein
MREECQLCLPIWKPEELVYAACTQQMLPVPVSNNGPKALSQRGLLETSSFIALIYSYIFFIQHISWSSLTYIWEMQCIGNHCFGSISILQSPKLTLKSLT